MQEASYSLGLEIAQKRFDEEAQRRETLDTKASLLLGFAGILLGIVFNLIPNISNLKVSVLTYILLTASTSAVLLSSLLALMALWVKEYQGGPGSEILIRQAETSTIEGMTRKLLSAYARSYQVNWKQNHRKMHFISLGFAALAFGTLLAFLAFLTFIWV